MANHKKLKKKVSKSKSQRESDKQKRNNQIVAFVLTILMIASLAGIALGGFNSSSNNSADYTYGNYKFTVKPIEGSTSSLLVTEVDGVEVGFYSLPQDVLRLNITGNLSFLKTTDYAVLTGNPEDMFMPIQDVLRYEIAQATNKNLGGATLFASENYTDYPVVSCLNASEIVPVIELVQSENSTVVATNNTCIKINSKPEDVLYMRDLLLYSMLGIIKW